MDKTRKRMGGRQKGTPNKRTLILDELLNNLDIEPIAGLKECLNELNGMTAYETADRISLIKAKADIFMDLLTYLYPKRKAIEFKSDDTTRKGIQIVNVQWADEEISDVNNAPQDEETNPSSDPDQPK